MTIAGTVVSIAVSTASVYIPAYKLGYTLYPVIFIIIAVNTLYRLLTRSIPALSPSFNNQPITLTVVEMVVSLAPLVLLYKKFGLYGIGMSFLINILFGTLLILSGL